MEERRDVNNKGINEYNKEGNNIADELKDEFQSCKVKVLNYELENTDISMMLFTQIYMQLIKR